MSQFNQNLLPPAVIDLIQAMRNERESQNYRENVAARLSTIAEVCDSEIKKFRADMARKDDMRRRRKAR